MITHHLAQINIARAKGEINSEVMKGFVERLDEINALAENSPEFVWRLQTDDGNATSIRAFSDPLLLVNMSVWESVEALKKYVYASAHLQLLRNKSAWFEKPARPHQALWWIPAGHIPTVEEGKVKLRRLEEHGPSEQAFTFVKSFASPAA